jgi:hypothetical protein
MPRSIAVVPILVLGLAMVATTTAAFAQDRPSGSRSEVREFPVAGALGVRVLTTREEREGRAVERSVVEGLKDGDSTVLSEVVDVTVRRGAQTTERTRRRYITDANGRQQVVSMIEERRVDRPDGGHSTIRDSSEPDLNSRSRVTRREEEETIRTGGGIFRTELEVAEPSINIGGRLVATERVEQQERRDGERLLERDSTTYSDPTGSGRWQPVERHVLNREYTAGGVSSVELIYRVDGNGNLVQSQRIDGRELTDAGGRKIQVQDIFFFPDINQADTRAPQPSEQVEIITTNTAGGGAETTRTVRERRDNRMVVVERVVERSRPGSQGGTVLEQETQRLDVNGRFQTVRTSRAQES